MLVIQKTKFIVIAAMLPCLAFAGGITNDVGNGTAEVIHGVGKLATNNQAYNDQITAAVYSKITELSNNNLISPGFNLQVTTFNGQTVISGFVTNPNDITTIYNATSQLNSIKTVQMNVTVKTPIPQQ